MEQYSVSGMTCAACSARVEQAVSKVAGVSSCSVSLLTNSMGVEGNASPAQVIRAVEKAGYGAKQLGNQKTDSDSFKESEELLRDTESPILLKRLIFSVAFLLALMYLSMGHMTKIWSLPIALSENHVAMGLIEMILSAIILLINKKFFVSGTKALLHGSPNMDTLVALGAGVSFVYSVAVLFAMTDSVIHSPQNVMHLMENFYFEGAAMIVTLITVGKLLESRAKGKTTSALKGLLKLVPKTARILQDGKEVELPISKVKEGDIFIVRPGENIPVDGIVLSGNSAVNESALTGESIPIDKAEGDAISAATINQSGALKCKATRVGKDTTLSQIIQLVNEASATKAPIAKIADKVSGIFVPTVICIAVLTFVIWLLLGKEFNFALSRGIAVLVVSCPCALGLATPVAIMVGNGMGAKNGILFKNSASLENAGRVNIVALDKTGTLTKGFPFVTDIVPAFGVQEQTLVEFSASLESLSEHPLAKAVIAYAKEKNVDIKPVNNFKALPGNGLSCDFDKKSLLGGSLKFIEENCAVPKELKESAEKLSEQGKTPLLFSADGKVLGIIAVADVLKDDSKKAVSELHNLGLEVVMLTGDNEKTANAVGKSVGVDKIIAGVLPNQKEAEIRTLQAKGIVAMVGDGINDAVALTRADLGIAIGSGSDIAIDAADIVIVKNRLLDVASCIRLGRATLRNIRQNLFWAFFYNIALIPIAAGAYYAHFGLTMNPMLGAAAMSLSSFCVVTNALRLNFVNIHKSGKYNKRRKSMENNNFIEKSLKVEGMMCEHCEQHVKEALESLKGVESANANHTTGEVKLQLSKDVKNGDFEKAIKKAGYKLVG